MKLLKGEILKNEKEVLVVDPNNTEKRKNI